MRRRLTAKRMKTENIVILFYFIKLKGGNQYENPDEHLKHCNEEEKEPQGILPGRADRCSGNYGNPGGSIDSVFDGLY